jgi:hypothetical protein
MVSLKTAIKSSIEHGEEQETSGGGKVALPLPAVTGGAVPISIADPHVEFEVNRAKATTIKGEFEGEV